MSSDMASDPDPKIRSRKNLISGDHSLYITENDSQQRDHSAKDSIYHMFWGIANKNQKVITRSSIPTMYLVSLNGPISS